ncbi:MAG: hypothetical protein QXW72_07545 [Conexivisphaerales archaeon]
MQEIRFIHIIMLPMVKKLIMATNEEEWPKTIVDLAYPQQSRCGRS